MTKFKTTKGEKFYNMQVSGMSYKEIADEHHGGDVNSVRSHIWRHRKDNNIELVPRVWRNGHKTGAEIDAEIRAEEHTKAVRRPDGVLECRTKTVHGFGFDYNKMWG